MVRKKPYAPSQAEKRAARELEAARMQLDAEEKARTRAEEKAARERESMMLTAGPSQKIKMAMAALTKALWKYELTNEQRTNIKTKIKEYQRELKGLPKLKTTEEQMNINAEFIKQSPELVQVFRLFWVCILPHIRQKHLSRELSVSAR